MTAWIFSLLTVVGAGLYGGDQAGVNAGLTRLRAAKPDYSARLGQVLRDSVGIPYHDGPLGEGAGAREDADPLIDLSRVDCVTFVEQSVALASSSTYDEAFALLQRIRYRDGEIGFASRNHFMLADWVPNNKWCVTRTEQLGLPVVPLTRTIDKADFFRRVKAPHLGQDVKSREVTIKYIPIAEAGRIAETVSAPVLVVFVGRVEWLFALHCGVLVPDGRGGGAFYHASSASGAVTATTLSEYAASQSKRYLGVTVHALTDPAGEPTGN